MDRHVGFAAVQPEQARFWTKEWQDRERILVWRRIGTHAIYDRP